MTRFDTMHEAVNHCLGEGYFRLEEYDVLLGDELIDMLFEHPRTYRQFHVEKLANGAWRVTAQ